MCEFLIVVVALEIHFPSVWLIYVHEKRTFRHKFWFYWNFYLPFFPFASLEAWSERQRGDLINIHETYMNIDEDVTSVQDFSSFLKVIRDIFHVINILLYRFDFRCYCNNFFLWMEVECMKFKYFFIYQFYAVDFVLNWVFSCVFKVVALKIKNINQIFLAFFFIF